MRRPHRIAPVLVTVALTAAAVATTGAAQAAPAAHTARTALAATCSQAYLPLPDPACTPGALNPDVTQDTIDDTICVSGYSTSIRPSTTYTNRLKVQQIAQYGYADTNTADYEEDHFIPLSLGGNPTDPRNLWPEPRYATGSASQSSTDKDTVEYKLYRAVCNHQVDLAPAQNAIATDWTTALSVLGLG
ncbi:hypothetical protein [Streptomyces rubellomurinus]|uniref:HNH endonuclease n=2 Tax=Streptomyces TaxID=1883 RepID=A0A0F2TKW2_STRR3|nr:hypothetical protein [Streptomyces rubellomurinus]KJS53620.1 hypothetical protein VM98_24210 [Streptomyces rubellomurinus subsp. indigoferus]KJS62362.1 hypothetical protein VM95_09255 [Streptomyces rubellomurinus]